MAPAATPTLARLVSGVGCVVGVVRPTVVAQPQSGRPISSGRILFMAHASVGPRAGQFFGAGAGAAKTPRAPRSRQEQKGSEPLFNPWRCLGVLGVLAAPGAVGAYSTVLRSALRRAWRCLSAWRRSRDEAVGFV